MPNAGFKEWSRFGFLLFLAGAAMTVNLAISVDPPSGTSRMIIHGLLALGAVAALVLGCGEMLKNGLRALREGRIVADTLFFLGVAASLGVSLHSTFTGVGNTFYEVPILLPAIRQFGALLLRRQHEGLAAASRDIADRSSFARVADPAAPGAWKQIPLREVALGQTLRIEAGEAFPADGIISLGEAYVQTQPLTGEPFPVALGPGGKVSAGMVAMDGALEMAVTALPQASELDKIAADVERLLKSAPPFLRTTSKALNLFVPAIGLVALATFLYWANARTVGEGVQAALAVILVACPCAFGIALPILFRRGLETCLSPGITPRDWGFLDALAQVKTVAFDKTGTLTKPEMEIHSLKTAPDFAARDARAILATLSRRSSHPVARPFWQWEEHTLEIDDLCPIPGRGVEATIHLHNRRRKVRLGNAAFLTSPPPPWADFGPEARQLYLEVDGCVAAACDLREELRPTAGEVASQLQKMGLQTALLTGDGAVAESLRAHFSTIRTSMRPGEKKDVVAAWELEGCPTLLIGDGLNDVSALTVATASIAVGESSPLAIASAQAHWHSPDYIKLPRLLQNARALSTRARRILYTAISYNSAGIAFAAAGLLHPALATIIMMCASTTVTAMAMRPFEAEH